MKSFRETYASTATPSTRPRPQAWDVLRDALQRGASVGAAAESLAAESSTVLSDAQKEDFCDLMAARDFGSLHCVEINQ